MNHSFDILHAEQFGIPAAILMANMQHWIVQNKANKTHLHDGHTWTYNSVSAYQKIYPYMGARQIRSALEALVDKGVLLVGKHNPESIDRSLWYAFVDESIYIDPFFHLSKQPNARSQNDRAFVKTAKCTNKTVINTTANTDAFASFWSAYPNKKNKPQALKAFSKVNPDAVLLDTILQAIANDSTSAQWVKDDGQFIPNPSTWLNNEAWNNGKNEGGAKPWEQ